MAATLAPAVQAWLRYLRSDTPCCSAFMLAVSFMMAASQRFEQPVTDALKVCTGSRVQHQHRGSCIFGKHICCTRKLPVPLPNGLNRYTMSTVEQGAAKEMLSISPVLSCLLCVPHPAAQLFTQALVMSALKDAAALAASPWLPAPSSQGLPAGETATGPSYAALRDALLQCVRNSAHGHGAIVQPMAGLAAMLMEAGGGADKGATYRPDGALQLAMSIVVQPLCLLLGARDYACAAGCCCEGVGWAETSALGHNCASLLLIVFQKLGVQEQVGTTMQVALHCLAGCNRVFGD